MSLFKYDPTCISLYIYIYIPMAMYTKECWGFFSSYLLWWYCITVLDVNAESCKSYSIADVLTSLSIIKKIQKLTLCNYFQATQGTGNKWQKIRQKESKNSQVNSQILNNKVKEWIQLECNSYGVMLKQFYLRKGHKPSLKVMRDDRFN